MTMTGTKITSDDGLLSAVLYPERDESVEIDDGAYSRLNCATTRNRQRHQNQNQNAILAGEAVAGARIVRKDRLAIL